jgi:acyl homoserine lactone synthase
MRQVTFGFHDMHRYGSAFYDFLVLRKRFFVDTLGWDIPHNQTTEMDQYDNPEAYYSLVLQDGEVIGGARVMPFSVRWGPHGCMLTDAARGKIDGIPADALPDLRQFSRPWECTRLVLADTLRTNAERTRCLALVVDGLVKIGMDRGAQEMVTLTVPALRRVLRGLGYEVRAAGDVFASPEDGRSYCVLAMPARHVAKTTDPTETRELGAGVAQ